MTEHFKPTRDVPLGPMTTLDLGGPARFFSPVSSVDELRRALAWGGQNSVRTLILGGGSNLVIGDDGYDGLVVRLDLRGVRFGAGSNEGLVIAAAGEVWDPLVERTIERGLAGLECLSGIPGHVGATPIQNVGAYGQEVAEVIEEVEVVSADGEHEAVVPARECDFAYRDSRFKREPDHVVVTAVRFRLRPGAAPTLRYPELQRAVAQEEPTLARTRDVVLDLRGRKSMVIQAGDENRRSVGSFFTNPILQDAEADAVADKAPNVPRFEAGPGKSKLAAAWLIEQAGIPKGYRRGAVGVSSRHTLALVHHGGGTTTELLDLARFVRDKVRDTFGVTLTPEPRIVGASF